MVAKHRRSEGEPSLMSAGAPVAAADDWPEAVGYGQAPGAAWPAGTVTAAMARPALAELGFADGDSADGDSAD